MPHTITPIAQIAPVTATPFTSPPDSKACHCGQDEERGDRKLKAIRPNSCPGLRCSITPGRIGALKMMVTQGQGDERVDEHSVQRRQRPASAGPIAVSDMFCSIWM